MPSTDYAHRLFHSRDPIKVETSLQEITVSTPGKDDFFCGYVQAPHAGFRKLYISASAEREQTCRAVVELTRHVMQDYAAQFPREREKFENHPDDHAIVRCLSQDSKDGSRKVFVGNPRIGFKQEKFHSLLRKSVVHSTSSQEKRCGFILHDPTASQGTPKQLLSSTQYERLQEEKKAQATPIFLQENQYTDCRDLWRKFEQISAQIASAQLDEETRRRMHLVSKQNSKSFNPKIILHEGVSSDKEKKEKTFLF